MKIKWEKIPLSCANACGGVMIGSMIGTISMYIGAIIAFLFTIYNESK